MILLLAFKRLGIIFVAQTIFETQALSVTWLKVWQIFFVDL